MLVYRILFTYAQLIIFMKFVACSVFCSRAVLKLFVLDISNFIINGESFWIYEKQWSQAR